MANLELKTSTIQVEHVTIRSAKSFGQVKDRLEALLPPVDTGIFVLLRYGEADRALRELEKGPALSIFGTRDYGALLAIHGLKRQAIQYEIGNPLTASKMARHQLSAGLYAPIRVLLREGTGGDVAFEYDRPKSVFGQFNDPGSQCRRRKTRSGSASDLARGCRVGTCNLSLPAKTLTLTAIVKRCLWPEHPAATTRGP